ncbi:hypothetical protein [Aestuariibacter sp. A3R04]|uniref:hypothetical protein n=1 Tax=Aestuariibacter sp. A3R04 TaxID=2841571 RepID=UPI001C08230C|nr:hypothetical protein [Aestuariibacter sp. A3R04]MBU3021976.1 hypothetical protein [Aestuariibacter sp. A3R04]
MKQNIVLAIFALCALIACSEAPEHIDVQSIQSSLAVEGKWIKNNQGEIMADPQTSGLTLWNGQLVTLSDASATEDMQRKLHYIDAEQAVFSSDSEKMRMANIVRRSCFSAYLADKPDLEALVADPNQPGVFYTVTEDATRTGALSVRCQQKYQETGSTDYPTLLVRLEKTEFGTTMTGVRPIQFDMAMQVGDFPNDGIEGMAMNEERTLYLGLEKDANGQPRIFSVQLDDGFWDSTDFVAVSEPALALPAFSSGNHPINGLAYYKHDDEKGYLLAAARNDNELWIIPEDGSPFRRILMHFTAPVDSKSSACQSPEIMDNASIEGLVVVDNTLWMLNDPWKENYLKNIRCEANKGHYEAMAPLLFSTPLQSAWFND